MNSKEFYRRRGAAFDRYDRDPKDLVTLISDLFAIVDERFEDQEDPPVKSCRARVVPRRRPTETPPQLSTQAAAEEGERDLLRDVLHMIKRLSDERVRIVVNRSVEILNGRSSKEADKAGGGAKAEG